MHARLVNSIKRHLQGHIILNFQFECMQEKGIFHVYAGQMKNPTLGHATQLAHPHRADIKPLSQVTSAQRRFLRRSDIEPL